MPHFNSRPSARGDVETDAIVAQWFISIHAPPRGATARGSYDGMYRDISIHAPPRGATRELMACMILPKDFNSRPSARGDECERLFSWQEIFQFTPLREGRPSLFVAVFGLSHFNSRPSARGDGRGGANRGADVQGFQFTPLREGRLLCRPPTDSYAHFNSRPSARGDRFGAGRRHMRNISIHAPPRGATHIINGL